MDKQAHQFYLDRDRNNPPAPDVSLDLDTASPDWTRLKRWQREFLVARSFCDRDLPAALRAHVSVPIVLAECARNPAFAAAREEAIARTLILGLDVATQHARDHAVPLLDHAIAMATNTDRQTGEQMQEPLVNKAGDVVGYRDKVAPRDQATFTRIGLEVAGALRPPVQNTSEAERMNTMIASLQQVASRHTTQDGDVVEAVDTTLTVKVISPPTVPPDNPPDTERVK